jgi:CHAD domain-containing protein
MPYRFEGDEPVGDGVKRIAAEELRSAAGLLSRSTLKDRATAIHEARKSIKKTRALLRLVKPVLGDCFERDNRRLQAIGRQLSAIRDAAAMLETVDLVAKQNGGTFGSVRAELDRRKRKKENASQLGPLLPRLAMLLRSVAKDARSWPLQSAGFDALEAGLRRTLKQGRRAMKAAEKQPEPDNFHEWRKRTKDHWYHVQLVGGVLTGSLDSREKKTKKLETWLGDDHNLSVLCQQIADERDRFGNAEEVDGFFGSATRTQKKLREKALSLGRKIHDRKIRALTDQVSRLWGGRQKAAAQPGLKVSSSF